MATTNEEQTDIVYKRYMGKASTGIEKEHIEEPFASKYIVYNDQLILGDIPATSPLGPPISGSAGMSGNVELIKDLTMFTFDNNDCSFYHPSLKNSIPFNYGADDGSYMYHLTKSTGETIYFGQNNWVLDNSAGVLTFFAGCPSGVSNANPPRISFYRYIGTVGIQGGDANAKFLQSIPINATTPSNGQVLVYDSISGEWTPDNIAGGGGTTKRIFYSLSTTNRTIDSDSFAVIGRQTWKVPEHSGLIDGTASVDVLIGPGGAHQAMFRIFDVTSAGFISSTVVTTGSGQYDIAFTQPGSDALLELQGRRLPGSLPNPVIQAAHFEYKF